MVRPIKRGLDYFPLDVWFFSDSKVRKVAKDCGPVAYGALIALFCCIYREGGYYVEFGENWVSLISSEVGIKEGSLREIANAAMKVGLFDKRIFKEYGVLTSRGIQERYLSVQKSRGARNVRRIAPQFNLLEPEPEKETANEFDLRAKSTDVRQARAEKSESDRPEETPETQLRRTTKGIPEKSKTLFEFSPEPDVSDDPHDDENRAEKRSEVVDTISDVKEIWNRICGDAAPKVTVWTEQRATTARKRRAELKKLGISFDEFFQRIRASQFLTGKNDKKWRATFDWALAPKNFAKILEGNYDDGRDRSCDGASRGASASWNGATRTAASGFDYERYDFERFENGDGATNR